MPNLEHPFRLLLLPLLFLSPPPSLTAQTSPYGDPDVLRGVAAVDALVILSWDDSLPGDQAERLTAMEEVFHAALRRGGVRVEEGAAQLLLCNVTVLSASGGLVVYSYGAEFLDWLLTVGPRGRGAPGAAAPQPSTTRRVITWTRDRGVGAGAQDELPQLLRERALACANVFLSDHREANPG